MIFHSVYKSPVRDHLPQFLKKLEMERISKVLPKSKRNKFRIEDIKNRSENFGTWVIRVKIAVIEYLTEATHQVTCEGISDHLEFDTDFYTDFALLSYKYEEFTFLCIRDMANDGHIKVSSNKDASDFGFRQRKVLCFQENAVFKKHFKRSQSQSELDTTEEPE